MEEVGEASVFNTSSWLFDRIDMPIEALRPGSRLTAAFGLVFGEGDRCRELVRREALSEGEKVDRKAGSSLGVCDMASLEGFFRRR